MTTGDADATSVPLELAVFAGDALTTHPLQANGQVTIGRADESNVRIDHPSVSRKHAILHVGPPLRIQDLGSANGTFVRDPNTSVETGETQDMRQLLGQTVDIAVGDCINLGSTMVVVRRARAGAGVSGAAQRAMTSADEEFVVREPAMQVVYEQAMRAAVSPISVLILGETGVGKEVLVGAIHRASPRGKGPLLGLNCAALSESLLESELFGHEKGAFTGATQARPGLIETADGGTVFLDEVGELPMSIQVKLLRVLEERKVLRVGSRSPTPIDIRVVAATNRDLDAAIADSKFRQDLFFRLNGMTLTIPPLRKRTSEIEPLARLFIANACRQVDRKEPPTMSKGFLDALLEHPWPGNVRELRNVIERAVVLCTGDELLREHVPVRLSSPRRAAPIESPPASATADGIPEAQDRGAASQPKDVMERLRGEMELVERQRIIVALEQCAGNQTQAAEVLGMSRRTLVTRIGQYGIPRPRKRT